MLRCPTINFQVAKVPKTLAKHIITKVSFNITLWKRHDYIVHLRWIWNQYFQLAYLKWCSYEMRVFILLQFAKHLNLQNPYENEIHDEIWHINLFMDISIPNWHIWIIDPSKMRFLPFFLLDTLLLTYKHLKHLST